MLEKTIETLRRVGEFYPLSALTIIVAALVMVGACWRLIGPAQLRAAAH